MSRLLNVLIDSSEKAANIARLCKTEKELFELLVEEKPSLLKNDIYIKDFKTLADVLIQEMVRNDIRKEFPVLSDKVYGEESNKFTNTEGESVTIEIKQCQTETAKLLAKVLAGNESAANILANAVHMPSNISYNIPQGSTDDAADFSSLGIWIDPIDATSEYIQGDTQKFLQSNSMLQKGLQCVTILIGVFNVHTGYPVFGVITQPFGVKEGESWSSLQFWNHQNLNTNSALLKSSSKPVVAVSFNELQPVKDALQEQFEVIPVSGAGYKCLTVIQDITQAFVASQPTTYQWDTCAPHAILLSLGGGIVNYNHFVDTDVIDRAIKQISYSSTDSKTVKPHCNDGGIIAYKNITVLQHIHNCLKSTRC